MAGHSYAHAGTTLYILVDAENQNAITDSQKKAIKGLLKDLKGCFPGVHVVKV